MSNEHPAAGPHGSAADDTDGDQGATRPARSGPRSPASSRGGGATDGRGGERAPHRDGRDSRDRRNGNGRPTERGRSRQGARVRDSYSGRDAFRGRDGSSARSPRPGQDRRSTRPPEPEVPAWITGQELDREARQQLRALRKDTAERTARHLVAALAVLDENPELASAHAHFAASIGGRIGVTRETYGVIAYRNGDYKTASRELRTAMRINGATDLLPMLADTERGLGRPQRALELASSSDTQDLGTEGTLELMIVVAGAYADTGDIETALRTLEIPALRNKVDGRWQVRLWVAYSDLLERAGRGDEARRWLTLAADADTDHLTDAAERLGRDVPQPPQPQSWLDTESVSVMDAYDETVDEEPAVSPAHDEWAAS